MEIFKPEFQPKDVFTPRGEYNPDIYVNRPTYEEVFGFAIDSSMCILVHGQSGTGKTWLTRRMLEKENIYYKVINLAKAANCNSIYVCFKNILLDVNWKIKIGHTEKKSAGVSLGGVADGHLETSTNYAKSVDYFVEFLKYMKSEAKGTQKKYIVFENMETVLNNTKLIKELANLITLIDDDEIAQYKTKYIIIGATQEIHQYFSKVPNINTIDNRLYELPDVGTLTNKQTRILMIRGFNKLNLRFESEDIKEHCLEEFMRITAGIPQRVHELCLTFTQKVWGKNREIRENDIEEGKKAWVRTSLNKNYIYISKLLEAESSFRNKVLYCVAQKDALYFSNETIDEDLRHEFPNYTHNRTIVSTKVLNELCKGRYPLLVKVEDSISHYAFADFKCALCLRAVLDKRDEKVYRNDIYEI